MSPRSSPRIAVFSDVHGNVPALEAVLDDLERVDPDEVLVGGDLVGRGPEGHRVLEMVRGRGWPVIRGNHEEYLLEFRHRRVPREWQFEPVWAASRWMAAELTDEDVTWIEALPFSITSTLEPDLRLVHGSPASANEGLGPWSSEEEICGHLASVEESLLVCAHTHRPLLRRFADGLVVNVGSVGLPFDGDPRASYAVFQRREGEWQVEQRRVTYPVERTLATYETSGFRAGGGITAELLRLELRHAAPYLVPFLKWAEVTGVTPGVPSIERFLGVYDPAEPLRRFLRRLRHSA